MQKDSDFKYFSSSILVYYRLKACHGNVDVGSFIIALVVRGG